MLRSMLPPRQTPRLPLDERSSAYSQAPLDSREHLVARNRLDAARTQFFQAACGNDAPLVIDFRLQRRQRTQQGIHDKRSLLDGQRCGFVNDLCSACHDRSPPLLFLQYHFPCELPIKDRGRGRVNIVVAHRGQAPQCLARRWGRCAPPGRRPRRRYNGRGRSGGSRGP